MPQILLPDNIPPLVKASSTTCTLASTHLGQPTRIKIGGQQYKLSSTLTLNTATTGLGGLDTGSLSTIQLWYVYACANTSGVVGLVASQTSPSSGPSGFTNRYTLVGAFYTNGSSQVGSTVTIDGTAKTEWISFIPTIKGTGGDPSLGVSPSQFGTFMRDGDTIEVQSGIVGGASGTSIGTGAYYWPLPGSLTVDVAKSSDGVSGNPPVGIASKADAGGASYVEYQVYFTSSTTSTGPVLADSVGNLISATNGAPMAANRRYGLRFRLPVSGWSKTLLG